MHPWLFVHLSQEAAAACASSVHVGVLVPVRTEPVIPPPPGPTMEDRANPASILWFEYATPKQNSSLSYIDAHVMHNRCCAVVTKAIWQVEFWGILNRCFCLVRSCSQTMARIYYDMLAYARKHSTLLGYPLLYRVVFVRV